MKWSTGVVRVVDEATYTSCESVLSRVSSRVDASPGYAQELCAAVLDWMHEIWPPEPGSANSKYVVLIAIDIDRMPVELLDAVAHKLLSYRGERQADPSGVSRRAAGLLACWLRLRQLETHGDISIRTEAGLLKRDYEEFFTSLLVRRHARPLVEAS